ncbi:MAG TPA: NADP-dependent oxidoreductase [Rudaea sp.]|uniref:NADP-dependent oxidoreductase n=1 Tax=Rudaea sp. TaxID=2136325 RepID=UPI002F95D409
MTTAAVNRRIVLARRPHGAPAAEDFRLESVEIPTPGDGEVLLRTLYLSLDPYMRGRMNERRSYAEPVAIDAVMVGGTVCRVETSRHESFAPGDLVLAYSGWQEYAVAKAKSVHKLSAAMEHPSHALGILGMPGLTAYMGLLDIGQPKSGETVAVAAATGPVGSTVGQIAKLHGCRAVGIAGGKEKCDYAVAELGFDACLDHQREDLAQQLAAACPQGIDVYFENVGGAVLDAVLSLLNVGARIPLCGLIAYYNLDRTPVGIDRAPRLLSRILERRVKVQGFISSDYGARNAEFQAAMQAWLAAGKIRYREDIIDGLQHAPQALMGLLRGDNFGKLIVRVAE